jgi:DNA-directed RNA polymerase subunit M/transcription elongation factor TFIIS
MVELNDFFNEGFGWKCRHCTRESQADPSEHSRFFVEGEAESKQPKLANSGLARWADVARTTLTCPECGISELAEKA